MYRSDAKNLVERHAKTSPAKMAENHRNDYDFLLKIFIFKKTLPDSFLARGS